MWVCGHTGSRVVIRAICAAVHDEHIALSGGHASAAVQLLAGRAGRQAGRQAGRRGRLWGLSNKQGFVAPCPGIPRRLASSLGTWWVQKKERRSHLWQSTCNQTGQLTT